MSDPRKIAAAFHRKAAEYDRNVAVQKRVVANLAGYLEMHLCVPHLHPDSPLEGEGTCTSFLPFQGGGQEGDGCICRSHINILDVGTGTGSLLQHLRRMYPQAALYGVDLAYNMCLRATSKLGGHCCVVNGDAQELPFKSGQVDLLVSASALQWVEDISGTLHELRRVLKPGGMLCIAFFCDGTLVELQNCFREVAGRYAGDLDLTTRLHSFRAPADVKLILERMDFEQVVLSCETETDWYHDVTELLRSIKNIGAGAQSGGSALGLGWRGVIREMSRLYQEKYGQNGRIPASYEVLYLYARTPAAPRL